MPQVILVPEELAELGKNWDPERSELPKQYGTQVGNLCDRAVAKALAEMLGGIPICSPTSATSLLPAQADCVEIGPTRIVGGIRPQNFDVVYRPDGVRFAYDSKTLNSKSSMGKNYQNMINDLGTEAATVHSRFPSAIVAFVFAVPTACLGGHRQGLLGALSRLGGRSGTNADLHKAEAIAIAAYDPASGTIDPSWPPANMAKLRPENFSKQVEESYLERFAGLPPHVMRSEPAENSSTA